MAQWGTVHVHSAEIIPDRIYEVRTQLDDGTLTAPAFTTTAPWGDTAGPFEGGRWSPPDGLVGITTDALACIEAFGHRPAAPPQELCDLEPQIPDEVINILDIVYVLDAFRGLLYPFNEPCE